MVRASDGKILKSKDPGLGTLRFSADGLSLHPVSESGWPKLAKYDLSFNAIWKNNEYYDRFAFSPDDSTVVAAKNDSFNKIVELHSFDPSSGTHNLITTLPDQYSIQAISNNNKWIVATSAGPISTMIVSIIDVATGQILQQYNAGNINLFGAVWNMRWVNNDTGIMMTGVHAGVINVSPKRWRFKPGPQ